MCIHFEAISRVNWMIWVVSIKPCNRRRPLLNSIQRPIVLHVNVIFCYSAANRWQFKAFYLHVCLESGFWWKWADVITVQFSLKMASVGVISSHWWLALNLRSSSAYMYVSHALVTTTHTDLNYGHFPSAHNRCIFCVFKSCINSFQPMQICIYVCVRVCYIGLCYIERLYSILRRLALSKYMHNRLVSFI